MADEVRDVFVEGIEVREGTDGGPSYLGGYAAVFNQETIIEGPHGQRWRERIAPGAFDGVIGRDDVIAAVNHDAKMVLGRSRKGTLALSVDGHGLRYDVKLPNTTLARDTAESVRRGDYPGSSFKFAVSEDGIRAVKPSGRNDLPLVIIERVSSLRDVGPVTFPAYEGTSVVARSVPTPVAEMYREREEAERQSVIAAAIAEAAKTPDVKAREAARAALDAAKAKVA